MSDFTELPDLAVRSLGGSVIAANDELFAERESLIRSSAPVYQPHTFGPKGQIYDGWETRRRREPGHDWAIIRLGVPGMRVSPSMGSTLKMSIEVGTASPIS